MLKLKVTEIKKDPFWWKCQDYCRGIIAIGLYKLGIKPKVDYPFTDEFAVYGYGHSNYYCGIFQFTIPIWYAHKHII
jgi:hypothetical protein